MSRRLKALNILIAIAVIAAVMIWAHPASVWRALGELDPGTAGIVILLNLPIALLFWLRSELVLTSMGYHVPVRLLLPISVLGNVAGALTPAASGEVVRASALRGVGVTLHDALALVLYERALSLYLLAASGLTALAIVSLPATMAPAVLGAFVIALVLPYFGGRVVLERLPPASAVTGASVLRRGLRYALDTAENVRGLLRDAVLLASWSAVTLGIFALNALQLHLLVNDFGGDVGLARAWVANSGTSLAVIISLLPFGIGVGDGSLTAILHGMGLSLEHATAVALLYRATLTLPLVLLALLSYLYLGPQRIVGARQVQSDAG